MMYEVSVHYHGRRLVRRGPAEGCLNWPAHRWHRITRRPLGLARAKAIADQQAIHATVCPWETALVVHDNGKRPGVPNGWWPPSAVSALEPRDGGKRDG